MLLVNKAWRRKESELSIKNSVFRNCEIIKFHRWSVMFGVQISEFSIVLHCFLCNHMGLELWLGWQENNVRICFSEEV